MAAYTYKGTRSLIPERILDKYEDLDPNYDGELWEAAADYIIELQDEIKRLKNNTPKTLDRQTCIDLVKSTGNERAFINGWGRTIEEYLDEYAHKAPDIYYCVLADLGIEWDGN